MSKSTTGPISYQALPTSVDNLFVKDEFTSVLPSLDTLYSSSEEMLYSLREVYKYLRSRVDMINLSDKFIVRLAMSPFHSKYYKVSTKCDHQTCKLLVCLKGACKSPGCKHHICENRHHSEHKILPLQDLYMEFLSGRVSGGDMLETLTEELDFFYKRGDLDVPFHPESYMSKIMCDIYGYMYVKDQYVKSEKTKYTMVPLETNPGGDGSKFTSFLSNVLTSIMSMLTAYFDNIGYEWNGYYSYVRKGHPLFLAFKGDIPLTPETFKNNIDVCMINTFDPKDLEKDPEIMLHLQSYNKSSSFQRSFGTCSWKKKDIINAIWDACGVSKDEYLRNLLHGGLNKCNPREKVIYHAISDFLKMKLNLSLLTGNSADVLPLPKLGVEYYGEDHPIRKKKEKFDSIKKQLLELEKQWDYILVCCCLKSVIYSSEMNTENKRDWLRWGHMTAHKGYYLMVYSKLIENQVTDFRK